MFYLLLSLGTAALDLRLKEGIEAQDPGAFPQPAAGGRVILSRFHNKGIMLNIGKDYPSLMLSTTACGFLLFFLRFLSLPRKKGRVAEKAGLSLIMGGAMSNLWDRWKHGYVVDYLQFPLRPIRRLVFNLGDLCILLGGLITLLGGKHKK